jgi:hypothetical protein
VGKIIATSYLHDGKLMHAVFSNNVLAGSLSSLDIDSGTSDTLLRSPQSYLGTVSEDEADRIRNILAPAYRKGFRIIFLVGAGLCAFAFAVAFFMMPQVELSRPDDAKLKEEGRQAYKDKKSASAA